MSSPEIVWLVQKAVAGGWGGILPAELNAQGSPQIQSCVPVALQPQLRAERC